MAISNGQNRYSKLGLWQLFVATAFPLHIWAIVLILMDISWVAERTNYWDAIGVAAYGLVFTLFESLLLWGILIIAGFLLPKKWPENRRITLLSVLVVVGSSWAILGQLYFLLGWSFPPQFINFFASREHPLRYLYAVYIIIITITLVISAYFALFSHRFQNVFLSIIDRLSILMWLYVFMDILSILIIIVRNIN